MDIHDLNVFATAARLGSITKAANALFTVQSNVTARIRILEDELGVRLFHRNHNGITLTPKGQELLPYAQRTMALLEEARETVSNQKEVNGILRIGSLHSTASTRLPRILKAYIVKYNKVDLAVETGTAADLTEKVLDHRIDGAFVSGPIQHNELRCIPAFVEELVMATPLQYRSVEQYLAKGPIPKVLVFKVGCYYRQVMERYLSKAGIDLLNEMEFGTLDGIIGCVGAGLGITMLPRSVFEQSALRKQIRIHKLPKDAGRVETLFIMHRGQVYSRAMDRLLEIIAGQRVKRGPQLKAAS